MVPKLRKSRKGSVLEDPLLWRVNYILAIISEKSLKATSLTLLD